MRRESTAIPPTTPTIVHVMNEAQILRWYFSGQPAFMRGKGLGTHIVAPPKPALDRFAHAEQVSVTAVPITRTIAPGQDFRSTLHLVRTLRRIRPAIVHAHTPKGGLLGMIAATLARSPVRIYQLHGLRFETATGLQRRVLMLSEMVSCALAHRVICVSESVRNAVIDHRLCPQEKTTVLLAGSAFGIDAMGRFDPGQFSPADRAATRAALGVPAASLVIGFVGRIVRDKGLIELADAWRALRTEFPDLHLVLVGPLERHDPLPAATEATLRQDPHVHFTGAIDDTPPMYAAMDLVVLPSYREGFPYALLEAAAMRLPVVATRVSGCVDAVRDGITGTLTPPRDAAALATAIHRYLVDPELRQRHGTAARDRVEREYRQEALWEAHSQQNDELLRQRHVDLGHSGAPADVSAPSPAMRWQPKEQRGKRLIDMVVALAGMILLAPLYLIVAAAIWRQMGRPIFFHHGRVGRQGRPFQVVKFRTLSAEVDANGRALSDAERVTPLGWFLRRTSIDELPQLWNVLRGDMSLVGPRPLEDWYIPLYSERERLRLLVRPGITGLAQISGRNILPWDQRLELDARYVEDWSVWLDLRILARTIMVLFHGGGVSRDPLAEGDLRTLRAAAIAPDTQRIGADRCLASNPR